MTPLDDIQRAVLHGICAGNVIMAAAGGLSGPELRDYLSIGISGIALIAAVIANVSSSVAKASEDRRQARDRVNDLCVRIAELNTTIQVHRVEQVGAAGLNVYNTRINSLVRQVVALATLGRDILAQSRIEAAAVEYALLADAISLSADPEAEQLWEKAVAAARSSHDRVDMLQRYAEFLFANGKFERGEAAYSEARKALGQSASTFSLGRNLQLLATSNANAGRTEIARGQFDEARKLYESIPEGPTRTYALNTLSDVRRRALGEEPATAVA